MHYILVVEDDKTLNEGITYALKQEDFFVYSVCSVKEARSFFNKQIDLVLLDITLPDGDGRRLCEEIHAVHAIPTIFLTARIEEADMIDGFDSGGDDYITKPFSMPVLLRRIRALIRRCGATESHLYYCGNLEIFLANHNIVMTRKLLLEKVWDVNNNFVEEKTLNVNILRLREKIEDNPREPEFIKTIFGIGYKWSDMNEN